MKKALILAVLLVCSLPLASDAQMLQGIVGAFTITTTGFVQSSPGNYLTAAGTLSLTFGGAVGTSHFVAVSLGYGYGSYPTTVKFNGTTMTCPSVSSYDYYTEVCYLPNVTGGTVAQITCPAACWGVALEFSGVDTSATVDQISTSFTAATSWATNTSGTLTGANEVAIGNEYCNSATNCGNSVINSPYTTGHCVDYQLSYFADDFLTCYAIPSSTTGIAFSGTSTNAGVAGMQVVFK